MGARGPRPAPTALRVVKGDRKDRINTEEPKPRGEPSPPAWLDEAGLDVWRQYAPEQVRLKVLKAPDSEAFGMWCHWVAVFRELVQLIRDQGETVEEPVLNKEGQVVGRKIKRHPAAITRAQASDHMLRYGARFGMTPSDRAGLKVDNGASKGNSAADLLSS